MSRSRNVEINGMKIFERRVMEFLSLVVFVYKCFLPAVLERLEGISAEEIVKVAMFGLR